MEYTVKILRTGGPVGADDDSGRLRVDLNKENHYTAQFEATMIDIGSDYAWVVRDSILIKVKIGEILEVTLPTP